MGFRALRDYVNDNFVKACGNVSDMNTQKGITEKAK